MNLPGDGAPGWTLEAVGLNVRTMHASGAAYLHQECQGPLQMNVWPTNNLKLGASTMYTLFFAGDDFAPNLKIHGEGDATHP